MRYDASARSRLRSTILHQPSISTARRRRREDRFFAIVVRHRGLSRLQFALLSKNIKEQKVTINVVFGFRSIFLFYFIYIFKVLNDRVKKRD